MATDYGRNGASNAAMNGTVGGVRGVVPLHVRKVKCYVWLVEKGMRWNCRRLGRLLASIRLDLFRHGSSGHGLVLVLPDGTTHLITKAAQLAPVLADSISMQVRKEGKVVSELPTAATLYTILRSEVFLGQFRPVDQVTRHPIYLESFDLVQPGYHDLGAGNRLLFVGQVPQVADSVEAIRRFLDVMEFAGQADRTNAIAAALTVLLRHLWLGEKPMILVTATKSHAGKGTVIDFVRGLIPKADLLYESIDWPMQNQFQRQLALNPELGMVILDNVRLDSAGGRAKAIRSAFVESFVTAADITLASPGAGEPVRLVNEFVVAINTNDGALSPDLLNRSLPIHLSPTGNVHERVSPIGNPKLEFLPANRERIEAELRGIISRWKAAGCPLDETVRHPMSRWARTVGGILRFNGFTDFLANYGVVKTASDPVRDALSILAAAKPGQRLRPAEWATVAVEEGLARTLFSAAERDTAKGRERAIGVILKRHLEETFHAADDRRRLTVRLHGGLRRWTPGGNPHTRYVFTVLDEEPLHVKDEEPRPPPTT